MIEWGKERGDFVYSVLVALYLWLYPYHDWIFLSHLSLNVIFCSFSLKELPYWRFILSHNLFEFFGSSGISFQELILMSSFILPLHFNCPVFHAFTLKFEGVGLCREAVWQFYGWTSLFILKIKGGELPFTLDAPQILEWGGLHVSFPSSQRVYLISLAKNSTILGGRA